MFARAVSLTGNQGQPVENPPARSLLPWHDDRHLAGHGVPSLVAQYEVGRDPGSELSGQRPDADFIKIRQTLNPSLSLPAALACL